MIMSSQRGFMITCSIHFLLGPNFSHFALLGPRSTCFLQSFLVMDQKWRINILYWDVHNTYMETSQEQKRMNDFFFLQPHFFKCFLQVGGLDDGILWIFHFSLVRASLDSKVTDLGESRGKVCGGDDQPGWRFLILVGFLVVLDENFWRWYRSRR